MKKTPVQTAVILAIAAAALAFGTTSETAAYKRRSSNLNGVRVDVLPLALERGKAARFEVRLNTHSVDLSQDLTAVSFLETGNNTVLRPYRWEGSAAGGHHRRGVLHFALLPVNAEEVVLTIKDIAEVPERTFRWKLK